MSSVASLLTGTPAVVNPGLYVSGGGGGGVTSLNALTGVVSLASDGGTIVVGGAGSIIDLDVNPALGVTSLTASGAVGGLSGAFTNSLTVGGASVLPIQTAYLQDLSRVGTQPIPSPAEVANIGATFQVPVTGMYALSGTFTVNVDGVTGATIGLEDSVGITVSPVPPQVGGVISVQMKPWSVPQTGVGFNGYDYAVTATDIGLLTTGVDYQMKSLIYNTSGTMAIPDYGFNGSIVSLCS
jgi:hypothetical protein